MLFRSYTPSFPLSDLVEDFRLYENYSGDHHREQILPSGTFELVFNLREDELRIYRPPPHESCLRFSGALVSGPYAGSFISFYFFQYGIALGVGYGLRRTAPYRASVGHAHSFTHSSIEARQPMSEITVNVRYMVDDVETAVAWYTHHLGFTLLSNHAPAFADVKLGSLRLLISGPTSSAGRPMTDGERPHPGGWNRIHLIVEDLPREVARLRDAGVQFRNDVVTGPGGSQILLVDPSGNLVELFQPRAAD